MLTAVEIGGELELLIETTDDLVGCPRCGAVARPKDRRPSWVRDLPIAGRPVVLCWVEADLVLPPRAVRAEELDRGASGDRAAGRVDRARPALGAFEQVAKQDAAVATMAAQLGVAWWTVMGQVIDRGTPLVEDPARLAPVDDPVTALGVDETAFLRATGKHSTRFATGIVDLTPGRPARLLDVVEGRSGSVLADWLAGQEPAWRAAVTTASLDPFRWVSGWGWLMGRVRQALRPCRAA